jgi:hypothetical protein
VPKLAISKTAERACLAVEAPYTSSGQPAKVFEFSRWRIYCFTGGAEAFPAGVGKAFALGEKKNGYS